MAVVENNIITEGLSGQIGGKMVFRQLFGETIAQKKGIPTGEPTDAQVEQRNKFGSVVEWAKANKNQPEYIEASRNNRRKFPGGYHAALHDAMITPELAIARYWRNGSQAFGNVKEIAPLTDSMAKLEFFFKGFSTASLILGVALADNQPSANIGGVITLQAQVQIPIAYVLKTDALDGSGKQTLRLSSGQAWQLDLLGLVNYLKTSLSWSLGTGKWLSIAVIEVANNYGQTFALDPINDPTDKLLTFGDALAYLETRLAA